MTPVQLSAIATVIAIVTSICGVLYMARQQGREVVRTRREELASAVAVAVDAERKYSVSQVAAVTKDLGEMTRDRDYWRTRADSYEEELRRRGDR